MDGLRDYNMFALMTFLILATSIALTSTQWTGYSNPYPYNTPSPTFSSLNSNAAYPYYYYTTPYPYTSNAGSSANIRIWPYVIGQYLYPTYNNNNYNDPYASFSNPNWQSWYANAYQTNTYQTWGKK